MTDWQNDWSGVIRRSIPVALSEGGYTKSSVDKFVQELANFVDLATREAYERGRKDGEAHKGDAKRRANLQGYDDGYARAIEDALTALEASAYWTKDHLKEVGNIRDAIKDLRNV